MKTTLSVVPPDDPGVLLDKKGTAKRMLVSIRTVDLMMRDRKLPYFKIGKSVRFRRADVDQALEKFRIA